MAIALVSLFLRTLLLFYGVAVSTAFSRHKASASDGSLLNKLGRKQGVFRSPSENITASKDIQTSDYMVKLFLKLAKPSGEVINPKAVKGNLVYGFTDQGELIFSGLRY